MDAGCAGPVPRLVIGQSVRVAPAGDDPIDDIVVYGRLVLSPEADALVADIVALGGRRVLDDRYGLFYWRSPYFIHALDSRIPLPEDLVHELRLLRDALEHERRAAGWEVDRLLAEAMYRRSKHPQPSDP